MSPEHEKTARGGSPGEKTPLILLIEDDSEVRTLTQMILRHRYRLVMAEDAVAGIRMAIDLKPDLILLDIYMAGPSGYEACRILKGDRRTNSIPVAMYTAGVQKQEVSEGYAAGADDYITKPFEAEDLIERIDRLLSRKH